MNLLQIYIVNQYNFTMKLNIYTFIIIYISYIYKHAYVYTNNHISIIIQ